MFDITIIVIRSYCIRAIRASGPRCIETAQRDPLNNKRRYIQYNQYIALLKANPLYVSIIFNIALPDMYGELSRRRRLGVADRRARAELIYRAVQMSHSKSIQRCQLIDSTTETAVGKKTLRQCSLSNNCKLYKYSHAHLQSQRCSQSISSKPS